MRESVNGGWVTVVELYAKFINEHAAHPIDERFDGYPGGGTVKTIDRIFGWLLFLGGIGHGLGSFRAYGHKPELLLWALCATLAVWLLAALNLLRAGRPSDHTLAWVSFAGCIGWIIAAVAFGRLIGSMLDFRALTNLILAVVLAAFSLRTAIGKAASGSGL